jgi:hypothetical protein
MGGWDWNGSWGGWKGVEWIHLAKDRDRRRGCCVSGDEPSGSGATEL